MIYIDPPYNTGDKSWKYNNRFVDRNDSYRHSKWLEMMERRLRLAKILLKPTGVLIVTIDEHEVFQLGVLLEDLFPASVQQMITIVTNPRGIPQKGFVRVEEYAIFNLPTYSEGTKAGKVIEGIVDPQPVKFLQDEDIPHGAPGWTQLIQSSDDRFPSHAPGMCYPIQVEAVGETFRILGTGKSMEERTADGEVALSDQDSWLPPEYENGDHLCFWPVGKDGSLRRWALSPETLLELRDKGQAYVSFNPKTGEGSGKYLSEGVRTRVEQGKLQPVDRRDDGSNIYRGEIVKQPVRVWYRKSHNGGNYGTSVLRALLGPGHGFNNSKSIYATADSLRTIVSDKPDAVVVDFFAGSGTTLHSVALLNAMDGGKRQCILVTNNEISFKDAKRLGRDGHFPGDDEYEKSGIFEAVTKPRVQAAISGRGPDGKLRGSYLKNYLPAHDYADGFEENVAFFRLDYLNRDLIQLGRRYTQIAPLLWMAAGSVGKWESWDGESPWSAPDTSSYAVLFDESKAAKFAQHVSDPRHQITHVWIASYSSKIVNDMRGLFPDTVVVTQLYDDYLRCLRRLTRETNP